MLTEEQRQWLLKAAEAEQDCGGVMACNPELLAYWKEHDPVMYEYAITGGKFEAIEGPGDSS